MLWAFCSIFHTTCLMLWQQSCIIREIPGSRRLSVQWDAGCSSPAPVAQGRHWSLPTASLFTATYTPSSTEFNCFPHVSCKTRKKISLLSVHALHKHSVTIHGLLPFYCPSPPPLPPAFNLALARSVSLLLCLTSSLALPPPWHFSPYPDLDVQKIFQRHGEHTRKTLQAEN